jgi:hypothetical protein
LVHGYILLVTDVGSRTNAKQDIHGNPNNCHKKYVQTGRQENEWVLNVHDVFSITDKCCSNEVLALMAQAITVLCILVLARKGISRCCMG